jgi:oxygen-dependent protoporphyrinogen oxidase
MLSHELPPRVAVIGGGISGLAAAHRLAELLPRAELTVFESSNRLGGVLETVHRDGFLVERSADSFVTRFPWAIELCRRIGIADQLVPTDESRRRALVVRNGKLMRVPDGFVLMTTGKIWPIITTPVLSWQGKLRLMAEPFIPRRSAEDGADESVASFATRRLGREAFERLVQPLISGIYTADPDKLSMAATLPELVAQEQTHGRLFRGSERRDESGARYGLFVAPKGGMNSLVDTLADRLPPSAVRLNSPVADVQRQDAWQLTLGDATVESFDFVIIAVPTPAAANLLSKCDPDLAADLAAIECAGCAVVSLAYRRDQLGSPLDGFGFVVPQIEKRMILAASYSSQKFPGRAPSEATIIRVFLGGAMNQELLELTSDNLSKLAHTELSSLLAIDGQPLWSDVGRWPLSMPQYHVGHLALVGRIEARMARWPGLELAGNAYHGVGIPQCVRSGEAAAERVVASCA